VLRNPSSEEIRERVLPGKNPIQASMNISIWLLGHSVSALASYHGGREFNTRLGQLMSVLIEHWWTLGYGSINRCQ